MSSSQHGDLQVHVGATRGPPPPAHPNLTLIATCLGLFLGQVDTTAINLALPALAAGLEMLPLPMVFVLFSPMVSRTDSRRGPRLPMTAGMVLMGSGVLIYALIGGSASIWPIETAFVIVGIGLALYTGPVVGVAVSAVDANRADSVLSPAMV